MYRRLSAVLFPVMTVLLIGAVIWGYQVNQEKNSILIKAENQYQRAFHDLSFYVDKLHAEIGNTLVLGPNSYNSQRKGLVNVWRLTSQAQNEINQLPLTLLPFNQTEELLSNLANFSYRASVRDLIKQPLDENEMKTLTALYEHTKQIAADLRDVQSKVIASSLRWMDVENSLATEQKMLDNTIIDGFQTVNKKIGEYDEMNWGPSMAALFETRSFSALAGNEVTADDILQKAGSYVNGRPLNNVQVVESGDAAERSMYSLTATAEDGSDLAMDFARRGGSLIWFMDSREVAEPQIALRQAGQSALSYLETHDYPGMTPVNYDRFGNTANITFASVQDGVVVYPDKLTVKVALDNGDVVGLQASDYLFEHRQRELKQPTLTEAEARNSLNAGFQLTGHTLALIKNDIDEEVLCHQFSGQFNGSMYRIYINADTGSEEKIELLQQAEAEAVA